MDKHLPIHTTMLVGTCEECGTYITGTGEMVRYVSELPCNCGATVKLKRKVVVDQLPPEEPPVEGKA